MARKKLTSIVIDALEDIKARDIVMLNVAKLTPVFDYIVIASADSTRQTKALARNVIDKSHEAGYVLHGLEGEQSGEWVLVDLGDIVVHLMQPAMREYYKLEELWQEGKVEFPKPKRTAKTRKVETEIPPAGKKSTPTNRATDTTPATTKKRTVSKRSTPKSTTVASKKPATSRRTTRAKE